MVPLLRVMLTSSESLLLCFTHASVDVLSFTASVVVYSGQICKGCAGTDACTFSTSQVTSLISCTFPATRGQVSPWRQPETNASSSKFGVYGLLFKGGLEAVLSPRISFPLACNIETS